jgi:isopentenyl-diphosphate delta-isomerase
MQRHARAPSPNGGVEARKAEHVRFAREIGAAQDVHPFDSVHLVHRALPELDLATIDPSLRLFGRQFRLPLVIASMTGGYAEGGRINAVLAEVAERAQLPIGVGSQRAALRRPELRETYSVVRRVAPTAFVAANIGAAQLVPQGDERPLSRDDIRACLDMVKADALVIHLNALQEAIQPEGDRNARGWLDAISGLASWLPVPIIAKETGGGISGPVAVSLANAGVSAIDVGGRGGTSFAAIEGRRAAARGDLRGSRLADAFAWWGIPTPVSVRLATGHGVPVIATGGVRHGLDAARAIALGAAAVGVGRPLLEAALDGGVDAVLAWVESFETELRVAMFLVGARSLDELATAGFVITGSTREWLDALGRPVDPVAKRP